MPEERTQNAWLRSCLTNLAKHSVPHRQALSAIRSSVEVFSKNNHFNLLIKFLSSRAKPNDGFRCYRLLFE